MTILVTGARGSLGGRVLARLAGAGHPVRGTARDAGALDLPEGAEPAELDVTATGPWPALRGVTELFLYTVRGDAGPFLAAAREAGVRHVVLLSSPAAYDVGEFDQPIGLIHRAMERAVADSGLPHTVVYPSWLATNARRDWGDQLRAEGRIAMAHPDAQVNPVHPDDVAEVAVALLTGTRHRARRLVVTGPASVRQRDLVEVLGKVLGKAIPVDELTREQAIAARPPWLPEEILTTLLDVSAQAVGVPAAVTNTIERVTGHPARPFADWARQAGFTIG